jgi:hypothetical protein
MSLRVGYVNDIGLMIFDRRDNVSVDDGDSSWENGNRSFQKKNILTIASLMLTDLRMIM